MGLWFLSFPLKEPPLCWSPRQCVKTGRASLEQNNGEQQGSWGRQRCLEAGGICQEMGVQSSCSTVQSCLPVLRLQGTPLRFELHDCCDHSGPQYPFPIHSQDPPPEESGCFHCEPPKAPISICSPLDQCILWQLTVPHYIPVGLPWHLPYPRFSQKYLTEGKCLPQTADLGSGNQGKTLVTTELNPEGCRGLEQHLQVGSPEPAPPLLPGFLTCCCATYQSLIKEAGSGVTWMK